MCFMIFIHMMILTCCSSVVDRNIVYYAIEVAQEQILYTYNERNIYYKNENYKKRHDSSTIKIRKHQNSAGWQLLCLMSN